MEGCINLSIVVPVYNSEKILVELFERIKNTLDNIKVNFDIVFVDDGSKDSSWKEIKTLKQRYSDNITGVKLAKNFGQHNATICGFNFCKGDLVLTMDDDLQHPPEEIPKLIDKINQTHSDIVYGIFINKKHSFLRNLGSLFIKKTSKYLSSTIGEGSSFRLFNKRMINNLKSHYNQNFLFIDEIIYWYTNNITTVVVRHDERTCGKSNYSYYKLISLYFNLIINYTTIPLRVMTYGGTIIAILTFVLGMRFIIGKLIFDVPLGYTSLIVAILFSTSLLLHCMGIIGEYIRKIYIMLNQRPPFSIDEVL